MNALPKKTLTALKKTGALLLIAMMVWFTSVSPAAGGAAPVGVDLPRFPSISPCGSEIVFSSGGDLWIVPAEGGAARRLTRHHLDDLHSSWSPDGASIVFTSMRDGYMNLWRISHNGTGIAQLTYSDRFMRHPHWARDERGNDVITFSSLLEADVYRDQRPYRISPQGGGHNRLHQAFGSEPRLSPDGNRVAFTRGGHYHDWNRRHYRGPDAMNVWVYDRGENRFTAVTDRDGDDGAARWKDDHTLVFMSDRALGTVNLYRVRIGPDGNETGGVHRLTDFEGRDVNAFDLSRDGGTAVLQVWDRLYTLDLEKKGAKPVPLTLWTADDGRDDHVLRGIDRDVTEAALSPDGKVMAYVAYGRVYIRHMDDYSPSRAVTPNSHARHRDIAWSPDGLWLYFTSDADGTSSIYKAHVGLTRGEIRLAYEEMPVYKASDPAGLQFETIPVQLVREVRDAPEYPEDEKETGHRLATLGSGGPEDPFAPMDPLEPPPPEPTDPGGSTEPADLPDPADLLHEAAPSDDRLDLPKDLSPEQSDGLPRHLDPARWHDAVHIRISPVVAGDYNDRQASPSPDGTTLAFRRGRGDLVVMDLATGRKQTLVQGWDSTLGWRWSPNGRYIAYVQNDMNFSANIFVVPSDGSRPPVNVTRHPRNNFNPRWSADGRILSFISNRAGESYDLYRVYLDPDMENKTRRELVDYFRRAGSAAGKRRPLPVRLVGTGKTPLAGKNESAAGLDLENAWQRVERVSASPLHQSANEMTPGGDRYVFNSGSEGLMVMNWDGSNRRRLGSRASVQHLDVTGDQVVYIVGGRVGVASLGGGTPRHPDISDQIRIDLREQSLQKFREAARVIEERFYRPDMKGLDWKAVVADYEALIGRSRTASEFSDITNRLMGELAASHLGVSNPGPASEIREPSGRLGIDYERIPLGDDRIGFRVTGILPGGPADRGPVRLRKNDVITSIDMREFTGEDTLLRTLRGKTGREVVAGFVRRSGNHWVSLHALLTPVDYAAFARLRYDAFQEESRRTVSRISGGRIGYIHIQAMNQASLEKFQAHLYAAAEGKDGLIIDVRNNGGGHTTDRVLTSIMAAEHAYTVPAGAAHHPGHYPQDRLDAPRYTLSINMLANEKSFSNAEILAHAFKTLDRGTLVGEQTYGGVISTGRHTLIDGATVRTPSRGWYLPDGTDMEHNGAVPDLVIRQTPEDEAAGRDRQLEAAVKNLLERLPKAERVPAGKPIEAPGWDAERSASTRLGFSENTSS